MSNFVKNFRKSKDYKNILIMIFDILIGSAVLFAIALFIILITDTSFEIGDAYVSQLVNGETPFVFKMYGLILIIVIGTSIVPLIETMKIETKGKPISHSFFVIGASLGIVALVLAVPVFIYDTASTEEVSLFGLTFTEDSLHFFFAFKAAAFFFMFLYLIILAKFFATINNQDKLKKVHKVGYFVLVLSGLLFFSVDFFDIKHTTAYTIAFIVLVAYMAYVFAKINDNKIQFQQVSRRSRLIVIIVILDLLIILFGDISDWASIFGKESSLKTQIIESNADHQPFASLETVLLFNLIFILGYIYLDTRFKIGKKLK